MYNPEVEVALWDLFCFPTIPGRNPGTTMHLNASDYFGIFTVVTGVRPMALLNVEVHSVMLMIERACAFLEKFNIPMKIQKRNIVAIQNGISGGTFVASHTEYVIDYYREPTCKNLGRLLGYVCPMDYEDLPGDASYEVHIKVNGTYFRLHVEMLKIENLWSFNQYLDVDEYKTKLDAKYYDLARQFGLICITDVFSIKS